MLNAQAYAEHYVDTLKRELSLIPQDIVVKIAGLLLEAQQASKNVFIMGNGGSAATAAHMACDFSKNTRQPDQPRLKAISLGDNLASLTAYANDEGYENVFSEPLRTLGNPGDLVIAISGSGNSPNIIKGLQTAKEIGLTTIGLTGYQGGKMKDYADVCLIVPSDSIERIEDAHLVIDHILTGLLRNASQPATP